MSSAYFTICEFERTGRKEVTTVEDKSGSNTSPWGTPMGICLHLENNDFKQMCWKRSIRKSLIHVTTSKCKLRLIRAVRIALWCIAFRTPSRKIYKKGSTGLPVYTHARSTRYYVGWMYFIIFTHKNHHCFQPMLSIRVYFVIIFYLIAFLHGSKVHIKCRLIGIIYLLNTR